VGNGSADLFESFLSAVLQPLLVQFVEGCMMQYREWKAGEVNIRADCPDRATD
jgi:hypothetical protein